MYKIYYLVSRILAIILAFASVSAMLQHPPEMGQRSLVTLWAIIPPLWFFFEYHICRDRSSPTQYERLKDDQALATKVWAGFLVALVALFLKGAGA